jgi:hypothetical protein
MEKIKARGIAGRPRRPLGLNSAVGDCEKGGAEKRSCLGCESSSGTSCSRGGLPLVRRRRHWSWPLAEEAGQSLDVLDSRRQAQLLATKLQSRQAQPTKSWSEPTGLYPIVASPYCRFQIVMPPVRSPPLSTMISRAPSPYRSASVTLWISGNPRSGSPLSSTRRQPPFPSPLNRKRP